MKRLFITGTGTDVGKTFVTAGLASLAVVAGKRVAVLKPVQTGLSDYPSDICEIRGLVPDILDLSEDDASAYSFRLPASPHLAAATEGARVDMDAMLSFIDKKERELSPDVLLIEGAGGVLVPLNDEDTFLDFMRLVGAPVLVVALAGLGTINHTLLTIEALRGGCIDIAGIIINRFPLIPGVVERDNIETIERFSGVHVLATVKDLGGLDEGEITPGNLSAEFASHPRLKSLFAR